MSALILKMIKYRSFVLMFLKGLNDMKEWGSKTLPHNKRLFPKWEFETLAEDNGVTNRDSLI